MVCVQRRIRLRRNKILKKVNNLSELVDLVGKDTVDKCFTENIMLLIAKANRLEKVESLMDRISKIYDKTDGTDEIDLKVMFMTLTEILCEYEDL